VFSRRPLGRRKAFMLPAFFCFVNAAATRAIWNLVLGRRIDRWEPQRHDAGRIDRQGAHAEAAAPRSSVG
jgi:hypothetical protein